MTDKEFEERMKQVLTENYDSMSTLDPQEFMEKVSKIPYEEFQGFKVAYIKQNQDALIETVQEGRVLDAMAALFERAFLFGFMLKGLDKQD